MVDHLQTTAILGFEKAGELLQLLLSLRRGRIEGEEVRQTINDELWEKATTWVHNEHRSIEGIAMLLANRVAELDQEYKLTDAEINALPAIRKSFCVDESDLT